MAVRTKHTREIQQLSLHPEIRAMLKEQANEADKTISEYIESIILEKDIQKKIAKATSKDEE